MQQGINIKLTMKAPTGEQKAAAVDGLLDAIHQCASRWAKDCGACPPHGPDPRDFLASTIEFGIDCVEVDIKMKPQAIDVFAPAEKFDTPKNMLAFIAKSGGATSPIQRIAFRILTALASPESLAHTRERMRAMAFEAQKTFCLQSIHGELIPILMEGPMFEDQGSAAPLAGQAAPTEQTSPNPRSTSQP